jgi:hypothetical protein
MRVAVTRSGGFAGLKRAWEADTAISPELAGLVSACPWDWPQRSPAGADRFVYEITAGDRTATVHEPFAAGPWKQLIDQVVRLHETHH